MITKHAAAMKARILKDLQDLVEAGDSIRLALADDVSKQHPLAREFSKLPAAVVSTPQIPTSAYEDQASNIRDYIWYIMVVCSPESVAADKTGTYVENLADAILNKFDEDCTLGGTAIAAVEPAMIETPGPVSYEQATYVVFYVTLKARQLVPAAVSLN